MSVVHALESNACNLSIDIHFANRAYTCVCPQIPGKDKKR